MADLNVTARWIFPGFCQPRENGVLMISDGRVMGVAKQSRVKPDLDFGNVAIVPGFVNAHTHLDLTGARGSTPPTADFTVWLRSVIAFRKTRTPDQVQADIREGILESLRFGTTNVFDISVDGSSFDPLVDSPICGTAFHEIIGMTSSRADASLAASQKWASPAIKCVADGIESMAPQIPDPKTESEIRMNRMMEKAKEIFRNDFVYRDSRSRVRHAVSPHAPYSVRFAAIKETFTFAQRCSPPMPITIHLSETREELELLDRHTGPFVRFLEELGAWNPNELAPNLNAIVEMAGENHEVLLAHCNYLPVETSIPPQCSIVYCPRTHAAFGHAPHPFREFLKRSVRVRLGTDSLASNPDLSILAEARFIASRYPDFDRATLLDMSAGHLAPGSSADFAVVALPDRDESDPHELLFNSDLPVLSTWILGECVFQLT